MAVLTAATLLVGFGAIRFGTDRMEGRVAAEVRSDLDRSGHRWARLEVSGRSVSLTGTAPSDEAAMRAIGVAADTRCTAWMLDIACAWRVTSAFDTSLAWPDLRATVRHRVLTLEGQVPDEATRWAMIDRARSAVVRGHIHRFVDRMVTLDRGAPAGVDATAALVARLSAMCDSGGVTLADGIVSIDCVVPDSLARPLRALVDGPLPAGYLGAVQLTVAGIGAARVD